MIKYEILFKNKKKWSESQQKDASEKVIYFSTQTTPYNWSFPNPTTYFPLKMTDKWKPFQVGGHQGRQKLKKKSFKCWCILLYFIFDGTTKSHTASQA